jgi:hypothetical protein
VEAKLSFENKKNVESVFFFIRRADGDAGVPHTVVLTVNLCRVQM